MRYNEIKFQKEKYSLVFKVNKSINYIKPKRRSKEYSLRKVKKIQNYPRLMQINICHPPIKITRETLFFIHTHIMLRTGLKNSFNLVFQS